MSDDGETGKGVSAPEERDRLIAEVMADAETRDTHYRVHPRQPHRAGYWSALASAFVFAVAGIVREAPPGFLQAHPEPSLPDEARTVGLDAALYLQAAQIEVYRVRNGHLPETLSDLSYLAPGVRYVRSGNRGFQLAAERPDGTVRVYDSALPMGGLDAASLSAFEDRDGS